MRILSNIFILVTILNRSVLFIFYIHFKILLSIWIKFILLMLILYQIFVNFDSFLFLLTVLLFI
jgi:hypothetical protein